MSRRKKSLIKRDALNMRWYFNEMLERWGIDGMYFQVKEETIHYNESGEMSCQHYDPTPCQMIFDQVPKVQTLKKLGWVTELDKELPIIHLSYDLEGIQKGALISIEDPLRPGKGRLFSVTKLLVGIIYPMCVTCQLKPVMGNVPENILQPDTAIDRNRENNKTIVRPEGYD